MEKFITILKYILLGLIQGVAEPLPISSSGHMLILNSAFGEIIPADAMVNFGIIVNFASLLAIIIFFRIFIKELLVGSYDYLFKKDNAKKDKARYVLFIIIASIPAAIFGVIFKLLELEASLSKIIVVGVGLLISGIIILITAKISKDATREEVTLSDSLAMGSVQVFALTPGISRSGSTTTAGVANRLALVPAVRFSYMMYIPISIGAFILGVYDIIKNAAYLDFNTLGYSLAFIASFLGTLLTMGWFFKLIKRGKLKYFGFYLLALAIIVIILNLSGVLI